MHDIRVYIYTDTYVYIYIYIHKTTWWCTKATVVSGRRIAFVFFPSAHRMTAVGSIAGWKAWTSPANENFYMGKTTVKGLYINYGKISVVMFGQTKYDRCKNHFHLTVCGAMGLARSRPRSRPKLKRFFSPV